MTTLKLNIGLASYEGSKYEPDLERMLVQLRKTHALDWVGKLGVDCYIEDRTHPQLDAGHEPTLVVVLFDWRVPMAEFKPKVMSLCETIGQGCIACVFEDFQFNPRRQGLLIGPDTRPWEPFDEYKFLQPLRRMR